MLRSTGRPNVHSCNNRRIEQTAASASGVSMRRHRRQMIVVASDCSRKVSVTYLMFASWRSQCASLVRAPIEIAEQPWTGATELRSS
jgi:hypothetical protein